MTYVVTWSLAALTQLAAAAASRNDRTSVDQAAQWIDYTLRRIPFDVGESRETRAERLWYGDILGVYFYVDDSTYKVRVISVGPARRH